MAQNIAANVAKLVKKTGPFSSEEHSVSHIEDGYAVMDDDSNLLKTSLEAVESNQNYKLLNESGEQVL